MKLIKSGLVILMILISGLGASSLTINDPITESHFSVTFSKPIVTFTDDLTNIDLPEANAITNTPDQPMLPMYKKTIILPVETIIKDVYITPSEHIQQIDFKGSLPSAPAVSPPGSNLQKTEFTNTMKRSTEQPYPEQWYEYSLNRGLYHGTPSIILTINCYPIRILDTTIYYSKDFTIDINTIQQDTPQSQNLDETLLIITPTEFQDNLQSFVDHKESKGISTFLVTLDSIYDGSHFSVEGRDDAEKVKY
ncbi:MAG TPA: C25 family cysteine peptidase, partial [Candidatus Thermoplasmatota archaeon]|nr:C25 family cysteine peptidase [Candidatus Thermoplasmatota archaeon]